MGHRTSPAPARHATAATVGNLATPTMNGVANGSAHSNGETHPLN